MLTAEGCSGRRRRLWEALNGACETLIVGDPQHLIYLANFEVSPFEFRANDAGALLILQPDRSILVADNLLEPYLERSFVDEVVAPVWYEGKRSAPDRRGSLVHAAREVLRSLGVGRLGVERAYIPAALVDGLESGVKPIEVSGPIRRMRRSKDPDEMATIRRAIAAADAGFAAALERIEPGMTEIETFLVVQHAAIEAAGELVRIYGDFVSGPRCERIGGPPTERVIEPGDLVLLDFSVVVRGYRGDCANTFVAGGGRASPELRDRFDACLGALAAGERALAPGAEAAAVDTAVRGVLEAHGEARHFPGHAGHGIGLGHPEPPYIVPLSGDRLEVGDVVTLEPGQYVPGVCGMRYEHNYRITESGHERLSEHLLTIERPG